MTTTSCTPSTPTAHAFLPLVIDPSNCCLSRPSGNDGTHRRSQRGMTLIELLIVIVIIAILVTIAMASYLGQQAKAHDAVARSLVRIAVISMETVHTESHGFDTIDASALAAIEPGTRFVRKTAETGDGSASNPNGPGDIADGTTAYFFSASSVTYAVGVKSGSGKTFGVRVNLGPSGGGTTHYVNGVVVNNW
jgi:prepilin-type N-terminal cleavage/methylation domain-containing protein